MPKHLTVRDIDDIAFQRKEWIAERVGWLLLAVLLVSAMAGAFSAGPLSQTSAESDDASLEVEYERFIRHVGTTTMTVTLGESAVMNGKAQLYVDRELSDGWRIEDVSPAPSTESSSKTFLIYEFDVLGDTPPSVRLRYRGDGFGRHDGAMRAGNGSPVHLSQWIYP